MVEIKAYKCAYRHCLHDGAPVNSDEAVVINGKRYHEDCAYTKALIDEAKFIYFNHINNNNSDYVQSVGVLNNLVFQKGISAEYIFFMMQWLATRGAFIKTPYALHAISKNRRILTAYNDPKQKEGVEAEYAHKFK